MSLLQFQLQVNAHVLCSHNSKHITNPSKRLSFVRTKVSADKDTVITDTTQPQDPPSVGFAFISPVLLPDGTPDIHYRTACGGKTLREIMMDSNIELYGPYGRALLNCAGGGTCATCMVEVLEDSGLLNPRTDKEKDKLKRKPKNWRLACQTTVGKPDSTGVLVIQQLPEWKGHEWKYEKPEQDSESSSGKAS